jgi:hypothetical protein
MVDTFTQRKTTSLVEIALLDAWTTSSVALSMSRSHDFHIYHCHSCSTHVKTHMRTSFGRCGQFLSTM